jgi:hypothetical protein
MKLLFMSCADWAEEHYKAAYNQWIARRSQHTTYKLTIIIVSIAIRE